MKGECVSGQPKWGVLPTGSAQDCTRFSQLHLLVLQPMGYSRGSRVGVGAAISTHVTNDPEQRDHPARPADWFPPTGPTGVR